MTTLLDAINRGDLSAVKAFLPNDAALLEKNPELALIVAARSKNPQIFNYLLKQTPGYPLQDLEKAQAELQKVYCSERAQGFWLTLLKSVCPSKSLADALEIPEAVAGICLITGAGVLSVAALPAAILATVGLGVIAFCNYKKLTAEQNLQDKTLEESILLAKINNFEKKLKNRPSNDELAHLHKELQTLKPALLKIKDVDFEDKKNNQDFLNPYDRIYTVISTLGEILCTNVGLASFAGLVLGAACLSFLSFPVVLALGALAMTVTTVAYFRNIYQQSTELAEQRRDQFNIQYKLYKNFKHLKHQIVNFFPSEIELLEDPSKHQYKKDKQQIFSDALLAMTGTSISTDQLFRHMVKTGNRRWFKFLMSERVHVPDGHDATGKTMLHQAVEKGHLLLVEEMLGTSIAAKSRQNKLSWINPYDEDTQPEKFESFALLQTKRQGIIEHYTTLHNKTTKMLLTKDASKAGKPGHLPLYYAAGLKDPSLYNLLLAQAVAQAVPYEKEDLAEALTQRLKVVNRERRWAMLTALGDSVCPGSAFSEVARSASLVTLMTGVVVLGPVLASVSIALFALIMISNYHKAKNERKLNTQGEVLSAHLAYVNSIKLKLASPNSLSQAELAKMQADLIMMKINKYHQAPQKHDFTKILIVLSALGSFLCAFAGTLAWLELGASALALTMTGPIGLVFLGVATLVALGIVFSMKHEQRAYDERHQAEEATRAAFTEAFHDPAIQTLIEQAIVKPMASLTQHPDHENCDKPKPTNAIMLTETLHDSAIQKPIEQAIIKPMASLTQHPDHKDCNKLKPANVIMLEDPKVKRCAQTCTSEYRQNKPQMTGSNVSPPTIMV